MERVVEKLSISGIETLQEGVKGATIEPVQLKPGHVTGDLAFAPTETGIITFGQVAGDIRLRGPLSDSTATFGVLTQVTGRVTQWGNEMRVGDFGMFPADIEHEAVYSANSSYLTIAVPKSRLSKLSDNFQSSPSTGFWNTAAMYRASDAATKALVGKCQTAGKIILNFPGLFSIPEARKALVDELISHFLLAFQESGSLVNTGASGIRTPHVLVRRAEDFLQSQDDRSLLLCELCSELGVSERTLRRAFVDVVGMPPSAYLRQYRLSRVRRRLLNASPEERVTEIAMQHGFWELGRFAAEYRKLFGEYPSQSLARRQ